MGKDGVLTMVMNKSKKAAVVICLMWCLVAACPMQAGESEAVKDGYYLGAMFAYNGMSGDFDDSLIYGSEEEADLQVANIPDLDNGVGFGIVLGRRYDKISFEVGYQRTWHDTSTIEPGIGDNDAAYNVVDLNVKIDVFAQGRLRPYVLLGGGIPWLTIEDNGSVDNRQTWTEDLRFVGFCLNAGVGVAYYFDPQWALTAGLIHRWNWFTHIDNFRADDDLTERAFGLNVGFAYTF